MKNGMDLQGEIENAIDSLIARVQERDSDPVEDEIIELGMRCGVLAVAVCYRHGHSDVSQWEPCDGDFEALGEMFGVEYIFDYDVEEEDRWMAIMGLFEASYKDAAQSTVDGMADVVQEWR